MILHHHFPKCLFCFLCVAAPILIVFLCACVYGVCSGVREFKRVSDFIRYFHIVNFPKFARASKQASELTALSKMENQMKKSVCAREIFQVSNDIIEYVCVCVCVVWNVQKNHAKLVDICEYHARVLGIIFIQAQAPSNRKYTQQLVHTHTRTNVRARAHEHSNA